MAVYRMYFRGPTGGIVAREDFDAADHGAAVTLASQLFDACSDMCRDFEVWQGTDRLCDHSEAGHPVKSVAEVSKEMQASLVEREEAIQRSKWAISRSRRLLERLEEIRSALGGAAGGNDLPCSSTVEESRPVSASGRDDAMSATVYRTRARELRERARTASGSIVLTELLDVARQYDRLADAIELEQSKAPDTASKRLEG